ncbi:MAG: phenylalanine--tRNA ligase subunit alpha [Patescibacteria group bacterium]
MLDELKQLRTDALVEIKNLSDLPSLETWRVKYLGRKGMLSQISDGIESVSAKDKPQVGQLLNEVKQELTKVWKVALAQNSTDNNQAALDFNLPGIVKNERGHLHPLSQMQKQLEELFVSLGFMVLDGPELESEYYNFTALNIPSWHPARDIQDTFFVKGGTPDNALVLRTHTSNMQVRALEKYGAPLQAVVPGRVFRYEATDASHEHTFWQMEGLVVDKGITVANLIAVMQRLLQGIFKKEVEVRLRPGYFPFVEPGFELDMSCLICKGDGCSVCKQSGWVEMMPCGLVHPKVLEYGGLDPTVYSGFAFGLGLSRLAMMKYGIDDVRLFLSGDLKFLEKF